jgi:hypothetical protein
MVLSILLLQVMHGEIKQVDARSVPVAFFTKTPLSIKPATILELHGGDLSTAAEDVEIDIDDIESSDFEEEEDDEEAEAPLDPKLAKSAQAATAKVKAQASQAAVRASKAAVSATLLKTKTDKKSKSGGLFHLPYIVKACLSPFVFLQMTAGYWKSLFNYKFEETLKVRCRRERLHSVHQHCFLLTTPFLFHVQDSSSDLRNSLQDKAKKGGSSSSRKKRKMKPGQAKTLSDLPQLNT